MILFFIRQTTLKIVFKKRNTYVYSTNNGIASLTHDTQVRSVENWK